MRFPAVRKPPFFHARDEYSSRTPKDFVVLLAAAAPPSSGLWPCSCRRLCGTGGKQSDPCLDAELHGAVHPAELTAWALPSLCASASTRLLFSLCFYPKATPCWVPGCHAAPGRTQGTGTLAPSTHAQLDWRHPTPTGGCGCPKKARRAALAPWDAPNRLTATAKKLGGPQRWPGPAFGEG